MQSNLFTSFILKVFTYLLLMETSDISKHLSSDSHLLNDLCEVNVETSSCYVKTHVILSDHPFESNLMIKNLQFQCRGSLYIECPKHQWHKGNSEVTPGICGAVGERPK